MILDEAIARYKNNAEYERTHGNLQGCLEFRQLAEWLKQLKQIKDIIATHDSDSMPEDYWYIDQIREVVQGVEE
jgi:hypothetical protein